MTMSDESKRTEELLSKPEGLYRGLDATGSRMSRRELLRYCSSTTVVTAIGMTGLLELLGNREAIAQGTVIALVGVTREPNFPDETPHRHTFGVRFRPTKITPSAIVGDVSGRTHAVISTGAEDEDQHFHDIQGMGVTLETLILSGTENNEPDEHSHQVSIE
jgi:hypothetical protein